jgi:hypothetical protein
VLEDLPQRPLKNDSLEGWIEVLKSFFWKNQNAYNSLLRLELNGDYVWKKTSKRP